MKKPVCFPAFLAAALFLLALPSAAAAPAAIYAVNSAAYTYHPVPAADYAKVEQALALPASQAAPDSDAKNLGGFCVFAAGGKSLTTVTETQVLRNGKVLKATAAQRKKLLDLCAPYCRPGTGIPELLGYMSPEKVTHVRYTCLFGPQDVTLSLHAADDPDTVIQFLKIMKTLRVQPGKATTRAPVNTTGDVMGGGIAFDTGVAYDLTLWDGSLIIHSSDASQNRAYRYTFADSGLPKERGWYLRSEMRELANRFDWLDDAVLVSYQNSQPAAWRMRQKDALCELSAMDQRFQRALASPDALNYKPSGIPPRPAWALFLKDRPPDGLWGQTNAAWRQYNFFTAENVYLNPEDTQAWGAPHPDDLQRLTDMAARGDLLSAEETARFDQLISLPKWLIRQ